MLWYLVIHTNFAGVVVTSQWLRFAGLSDGFRCPHPTPSVGWEMQEVSRELNWCLLSLQAHRRVFENLPVLGVGGETWALLSPLLLQYFDQ